MQHGLKTEKVPDQSLTESTVARVTRDLNPDTLGDLLSEMKSLGDKYGDDEALPPSQQGNVKTIKTLVKTQLLGAMLKTRNDAEANLKVLIAAIAACNKNSTADQAKVAASNQVSVGTARSSHSTCRAAQKVLLTDKTTKCDDLKVFMEGIALPATLPSPATAEAMGPYLKTMGAYFCGKHPIFVKKNTACKTATVLYTNKTTVCDASQDKFQADFCLWRLALTAACKNAKTCYDTAVAAFNKRWAVVSKTLIPQWKVEWAGLKKILCYTDIWMSDNNVKTVNKKKASDCQALKPDTTPMDIAKPAIPPMILCDETPVSKYPCTTGFVSTEYTTPKVPLTKTCTAPTSCAAGAVVKPVAKKPAEPVLKPQPTEPVLKPQPTKVVTKPKPKPCVDDNAGLIKMARGYGMTKITGCSSMRATSCINKKIKSLCPKTCKTCASSKCVDQPKKMIALAAKDWKKKISGCGDKLVLAKCKIEFAIRSFCPVSCKSCKKLIR
jgi:hypothetical protein